MSINRSISHEQLEQACRSSQARWAAWLWRAHEHWQIIISTRIPNARHTAIENFIQDDKTTAWLAGSLHTGRIRSRTTGGSAPALGCQRVFSFANHPDGSILLVGADGLSSDHQSFFRILSISGLPANDRSSERADRLVEISQPIDSVSFSDEQSQLDRSRKLELIHQVVERIVGLTDEAEIAQVTADLVTEYFGYEFVVILVSDKKSENLTNLGVGGTKKELIQRGFTYSVTKGITGRVFRTGESYFTNQPANDPEYFTLLNWQAGTEICIPLREGENVFGIINIEHSNTAALSDSDQILLESLAGILSSVMMNARRYQQLNDNIKQLQAVREIGLDIYSDLEFDSLLKRIVHRARELVGARGAEIGLYEEENKGIRVQTSENPWYDITGHLIPLGKGVAGQILETGQPVCVHDYANWPHRLWPGTAVDFVAVAGVPLLLKGQVIGTLVVMDDRPERVFSDDDMQNLEMIALNIALAIHNAQLIIELQDRIEAHRQAESRLIQSERLATAGRLTASIAHEINNPLQALQNCLHLAERHELSSAERHRYLSMARLELDRLISLVQRMLDFYRPGVRDRQSTDINDVICRLVDLIEPQLLQQEIRLHVQYGDDLPPVMTVSSQIQQVLLNLILNAMDAMPQGGDIFIETAPSDFHFSPRRKHRKNSTAHGVEITIRDTGPGIPIGDRDNIFEPFISSKENGMGLGLSVSYGIIQAHGGSITLGSDDMPGACFRIILPEENKS